MINSIIVEDEYYARQELQRLVEESGKVKVLSACENALEALKAINEHKPDLLFLDINLPMIDGFELLTMIEKTFLPKVIFTTAYDEYAVKAFDEDAVDYILKPIEKDRLFKSIDKMEVLLKESSELEKGIERIADKELKRIPSSLNRRIKLIPISDIDFVNTDSTATFVVCGKERSYTDLTLKVIESRSSLLQCHKQYLFNPEKIVEIKLEDNQTAKLITESGNEIPVSRSYLKRVKENLMF